MPMAPAPKTSGSPQPRSGCEMSARTGPASPSAHSTAPTTSTRAPGFGVRPTSIRLASASVTRTKGTLMAKIARHDATSTSHPPTSGPMTNAIPLHAVQEPIAAPRSSRGNAATMSASDPGVSSAPNAPCSARPRTSTPIVGATAQMIDTAPNPPTPTMKTRRSPNRSPSDPPMRMSEPSMSR